MTRLSNAILSMLLWTWGGTVYFLMEVAWKTINSEPEKISWTMLVLAVILTSVIERFGAELPWSMPLVTQAFVCAICVTVAEFIAGLILNVWLSMNIWDYSHLWGNILGQICPQFFLVWFLLCLVFIVVFDWMRYAVVGGKKPTYSLL